MPHGFQQFQIVLLAPHQEGTKQYRRCNHATCSLVYIWAHLGGHGRWKDFFLGRAIVDFPEVAKILL